MTTMMKECCLALLHPHLYDSPLSLRSAGFSKDWDGMRNLFESVAEDGVKCGSRSGMFGVGIRRFRSRNAEFSESDVRSRFFLTGRSLGLGEIGRS